MPEQHETQSCELMKMEQYNTSYTNPWVTQIHELRVQIHELRVQIHELWVQIYESEDWKRELPD